MSWDAISAWRAATTDSGVERKHAPGLDEAVVALFDQMRDRLMRYLMTLRLSTHDGEEIIQDVFVALFLHLERGRPRHNLPAWIFQVTHNMALKRLEKEHQSHQSVVALGAVEYPSRAPSPEDECISNERSALFTSVWNALTELDRRCLSLRAEGLTYREIAEVLNISLGGVSSSLARSLARFTRAEQR